MAGWGTLVPLPQCSFKYQNICLWGSMRASLFSAWKGTWGRGQEHFTPPCCRPDQDLVLAAFKLPQWVFKWWQPWVRPVDAVCHIHFGPLVEGCQGTGVWEDKGQEARWKAGFDEPNERLMARSKRCGPKQLVVSEKPNKLSELKSAGITSGRQGEITRVARDRVGGASSLRARIKSLTDNEDSLCCHLVGEAAQNENCLKLNWGPGHFYIKNTSLH